MTNKEVIEDLKKSNEQLKARLKVEMMRMETAEIKETKYYIERNNLCIQALEQTQWIPVSERLPTKEEYIANNGLFIVSDGNRTYAEYFDVYCSMRFGEPTMDGFRVDRCVDAWMPLPKSYLPDINIGNMSESEVSNEDR